jgi:hypothetical protein
MTIGPAMHRYSSEVSHGPAIDDRPGYFRRSQDAEQGSERLRIALERQFLKVMRSNSGISIHDARLLCMNATPLRRR